jgi:hypothetical protein
MEPSGPPVQRSPEGFRNQRYFVIIRLVLNSR